MRKLRVYVDAGLEPGIDLALPPAQTHYLKNVLRLIPGAALQVFNGCEAAEYTAELMADGKRLYLRLLSRQMTSTESKLRSEIIQGLGRADHMDWMIQKATELGVTRISLFPAERTQTTIKAAQLDKKLQHWRGVAISACEQCGRSVLPDINYHTNIAGALKHCESRLRLLLDFDGPALREELQPGQDSIAILLGPEGGLNPVEIELGETSGFTPARLGPRVLRTETAATSALAIAQALLGDLN